VELKGVVLKRPNTKAKLFLIISFEPISLLTASLVSSNPAYMIFLGFTIEPVYNDIRLCDTSYITSDILWFQLISHC
jgi:hypothetical protein